MHGISIRYEYSGDETRWEKLVKEFIANIDNDEELNGNFKYRVNIAKEGKIRFHWGEWDDPKTVEILQSRQFFKDFAGQLKEMADETLSPVPLTRFAQTAG